MKLLFSESNVIDYEFDYNNFVTTGTYFAVGGASYSNGPTDEVTTNCFIIVLKFSTWRGFQFVTTGNNIHAYYRSMAIDAVGNWNEWIQI